MPLHPRPTKAEMDALQEIHDRSLERPSAARCYDYLLDGNNNYPIDRQFLDPFLERAPMLRIFARLNRLFLGRATDYLVRELGIRQIVDVGSGLPVEGAVHEVAEAAAPGEVRVVYIDNEPVAHAHAGRLLKATADPDRSMALWADFNDTERMWERILQTGLVDPTQPVGLYAVALLHFMLPALQPDTKMDFLRGVLPPGSALVLSHATSSMSDQSAVDALNEVVMAYREHATHAPTLRTAEEIQSFFGDFEIVEPFPGAPHRNVVWLSEWRPNDDFDALWHPYWPLPVELHHPEASAGLCGVAVKPGRPAPAQPAEPASTAAPGVQPPPATPAAESAAPSAPPITPDEGRTAN